MNQSLKDARIKAGITIYQASQDLSIRRCYLEALEKNRLDLLPGEVYANGYLKIYANYLKIDLNELRNDTPLKEEVCSSLPLEHSSKNKFAETIFIMVSLIMLILFLSLVNEYLPFSLFGVDSSTHFS